MKQPSSIEWLKGIYDDLAFRYLAADEHPDHDTIASFCQQQLEVLAQLFVQTVRLQDRSSATP